MTDSSEKLPVEESLKNPTSPRRKISTRSSMPCSCSVTVR